MTTERVTAEAPATTYRDPLALAVPDSTLRSPRTVTAPGRVAALRRLTHDTIELRIACASDGPRLRARAGQFAVLRVDGVAGARPFSFARAPSAEAPGVYTFLIRCVPGGAFSSWLSERARVGMAVEVIGPLGRFGLSAATAPMVCIAGGSGLSAVKAILEYAAACQIPRDCRFYYGVRTQADLCYGDELRALAARWHPAHRFEFVEALSEESATSGWTGARGLVTDIVASAAARGDFDLARAEAYLCGPPPMIAAAARLFEHAGMPASAILRDVFEDVRSPAPVIDNQRCVLCDECLLVKPLANCIVEAGDLEFDPAGKAIGAERVRPTRSSGLYYNALFIDETVCIRCNACVDACPHGAISPGHSRHTVTLRHKPRVAP